MSAETQTGTETIAEATLRLVVDPVARANPYEVYDVSDPDHSDRPSHLDLRRPDPAPLSFGGGPHLCLGAALARLEGAIAFQALAAQVPDLQLAETDPRWRRALNLRGLESLRVTATAGG